MEITEEGREGLKKKIWQYFLFLSYLYSLKLLLTFFMYYMNSVDDT